MLNKNSLLTGTLLALIFPAIAWITAHYLKNNIDLINRPALPYWIAIGLNLIMLRFAFKKDLDKTSNGIMLTTFAAMIAIFMFKAYLR
ncbi:MAG: hypothetical protein M3O71_28325 [Bacteroidota bacterium]|nr:hypothetical protein [Bacteroidota bacterium]